MSGYIKYFDNGEKVMSFKIKVESMYLKYTETWNKIKDVLNVKFHNQPIYDDKYIKTFNNIINTLFSGDEIPKERIHYVCIAVDFIDDKVDLSSDDKQLKSNLLHIKNNFLQIYTFKNNFLCI